MTGVAAVYVAVLLACPVLFSPSPGVLLLAAGITGLLYTASKPRNLHPGPTFTSK